LLTTNTWAAYVGGLFTGMGGFGCADCPKRQVVDGAWL
jgi:hypothetical protein